MDCRRAVAVAVLLLFVLALLLAAGCGKKKAEEPATEAEETTPAEGYIKKGLKAPGEAREAQEAAEKHLKGQDESVKGIEGGGDER
jgi:cytochrome oxidase Cu insertion factor (SCO1/SenC/PrrC family)